MSLNGLDDPAVIESYQTALTEAGGWFLLKYVARDVVALLGRGTGGVAEIRVTIDGYEEASPLYGFLQYRRRKVILRYVPEGISRLLQARITVQFQSVLDRFSPNDAIFSLSVSSELTESALSSACLLHAASGSMTSSSSSLRRRRLGEITEDAEESSSPTKDEPPPQQADAGRQKRPESVFSRTSEATAVPGPTKTRDTDTSPRAESASRPSRDEYGTDRPLATFPRDRANSRPTVGSVQRAYTEELSSPISEPRKSTQSTRPSLRDFDQTSLYRPKVKLGPRPSMDTSGRPRTAGSLSKSSENRPVASLPSSVKFSSRRSGQPRPKSQPDAPVPALPLSAAPPVPALLIPPPLTGGQLSRNAPSSPRSALSVPASFTATPEKQRLMRALQLRKKQMEKRTEEKEAEKSPESTASHDESNKVNAGLANEAPVDKKEADVAQRESGLEQTESQEQHISNRNSIHEKKPSLDASKPDSAVDVDPVDSASVHNIPQTPSSTVSATSPDLTEKFSTPTSPSLAPRRSSDSLSKDSEADKRQTESEQPEVAHAVELSHDDQRNSASTTETPTPETEERVTAPSVEVSSDVNSQETDTPKMLPVDAPEDSTPIIEPPKAEEAEERPTTVISDQDVAPSKAESIASSPQSRPASTVVPAAPADARSNGVAGDETEPNSEQEEESDAARHIKDRRRGVANLHVVTHPEESDDEGLLSDDSFLEELKSATLQEAKPITVPKSPMPNFPNMGGDSPAKGSRAVSSPTRGGFGGADVEALPVGRSASGSYYDGQNPVPVLVAKKVNVSSGISKRIKALEMFSSRETSASPTPPVQNSATTSSASAFEKFRKRASMSQASLTPAPSPDNRSAPHSPTTSPSPETRTPATPRRQDSLSPNSRTKSNSVSVTARIVRDPIPSTDSAELQRSTLIVEQDNSERRPSGSAPSRPIMKRSQSTPSNAGSLPNSNSGSVPRSDSVSSRLSISSRHRLGESGSRSSVDLGGLLDSVDEAREEKKESRKSRIIRRMSSITSNSRRGLINAISPTVREEESPVPAQHDQESTPEPAQAVDIGEVNVQFPDTLLWKRRFMRVDEQGYLILTPGTIDGTAINMVKRYHLSEFRRPYLPDQDSEELPYSIVFDFQNGSCLQCACESRQNQNVVLQTILDAHNTYQSVPAS